MKISHKITLTAVALMLMVGTAHAADMQMDHSKMDHGAMMKMAAPATDAPIGLYDKAMHDMHTAMSSTKATGDADVDFVSGMIPHHQGAVDMAKVELANGKDPEIKKLAEGIVVAQEKEIAFMKEWLKKHGK